jgi:predicted DNA-binding transcriptional regulator AlpA
MPPSPLLPKLEPLISGEEICKRVGFSRQTLRRLVRAKEFPAPLHVSKARLAWRLREVEAWVNNGGLTKVAPVLVALASSALAL